MPGPGAQEVGRVSIRVLPDSDGFRARLRGQLASETAGLTAKVEIEPDFDLFRQRIQAELARVSQMKAKVDIGFNLDTAYLRGQLTFIVRKAARGIEAHIRVRWVPSVAVLRAELQALVRAASAGIDTEINVKFKGTGTSGGGGIFEMLKNPYVITAALATIQPAIQTVYGLYTAIQNLLPLLLAVPGAIFSLGAVGATAALGLKGFFDAFDEKKGAKAFASLAPNAKATVTELKKFGKEYKALQQLVQNEVFEGIAKPAGQVAKEYLPILNNGLRLIGGQLNKVGKGFLTALVLPTSKNSVADILESTRRSMIGLGPATSNFTQGLLRLGAFGAKQFEKVGLAADKAAAKFALWVDEGVSTGRFQQMFDKAIQTAKDFWAVLKNIAAIIGIVVKGMNQGFDSQSWLGNLRKSTEQLKEFLKTAEAQEGLKGLGQTLDAITKAVKDVFLAALKELAPIMRDMGPVIQEFAKGFSQGLIDGIRILGEVLQGLAGFLRENKDLIGAIAPSLGHLAAALIGVKIAKGIISKLRQFGSALRGLSWLGKLGLWWGIFELADSLDRLNMAAAGGDESKLNFIDDQLHNIVGAAKEILTLNFSGILKDIGEEWDMLVAKFNSGESPIGAAFQSIKEKFEAFKVAMGQIGDNIGTFFSELPGKISAGLSLMGELLFGQGIRAIGEFLRGANQKYMEFQVWLAGIPQKIVDFFTGLPAMLFGSGNMSFGGFQGGATAKVGEIIGWIAGLPNRFTAALGNLGKLLWNAGGDLMRGLYDGIVSGLKPIIDYVSRIAAWIRSVKGPESYDKKVLRDPGLWMMEGLHDGLKDGLKDILKDVQTYADQIAAPFESPINVNLASSMPGVPTGTSGYSYDLLYEDWRNPDQKGMDFERLIDQISKQQVTLVADGHALATVVNKSNTRTDRRR